MVRLPSSKKDQDPEEEASKEVRYEEGMRQGVQNIVGSDLTNETMRDCKVYKGGYAWTILPVEVSLSVKSEVVSASSTDTVD